MRPTTSRDVLSVFWQHTLRYKGRAFLIVVGILIATGADSVQPWILKRIFDLLAQYAPTTTTIETFIPALIALVVVQFVGWFFWRSVALITNRLQPWVMRDLEQTGFEYLLGHSYQFFADHFGGSLVRRVNRLARAYERLADEIEFSVLPTTVVLIGATIALALRYPPLAAIFVVWSVVFILFILRASKWAVKADIERARLDSVAGGVLADAITNAVTIKLFPAFRSEANRYKKAASDFADAQTVSWDKHEAINAAQSALMILVNVALMWIGVVYWLNGTLTLGDLALIQSSLTLVFGKLWGLGRSFRHIFDSMADGKEMVDLMREPHEVRDAKKAKALRVRLGAIDFKRVTFRFHKKRCVLDNFSLSIKPREKIALVGPSGAGKTTITKLLFRFYDVDSGSIRIDGQDIGGVTQDSLRNAVSLVPQDPVLFHRTLMDNIRYGRPDASNEEVMQAARQAHCHEFIEALPEGYGTYVGERGVKLSGGERQRVAIARAILKNAPILVLDEATSSLDSESESLIQSALHSLMRDKTVIVVAHRLSTIMAMDRILVIENGAIASQGTHAQLLKQKGTYQKLWDIQAGGFAE